MGKTTKDKNAWYIKLFNLLKLETTTVSGRINLAGTFIVMVFCLLYVAGDGFQYLISSAADTIKSIALNTDIHHPYESNSVVIAAVPVLIVFTFCLIFLCIDDKRKKELLSNDKKDTEES